MIPRTRLLCRSIAYSLLAALLLIVVNSAVSWPRADAHDPPQAHAAPQTIERSSARADLPFQLFLPLVQSPFRQFLPVISRAAYDWLQFNGDPQHSGNNTREEQISRGNVAALQLLYKVSLPGVVDGVPVFLAGVNTPAGAKDMLYVTTRGGELVALDARTGARIWTAQHPSRSPCYVNNVPANGGCFTTASPAVDPNRQYVYSYGLDGYAHKHRVADGDEVIGGGWPQLTTLKGFDEKVSSNLSIATDRGGVSYLYVTHAGYPGDPGDAGDYQGHITSINLNDGTQIVFNAECSDQAVHFAWQQPPDCPEVQAGIWSRSAVVYDAELDRIFATSSNGTFDPSAYKWGDTVVSLPPSGVTINGTPLDSYTPVNYKELQDGDLDLGSTTIAILPAPPNSNVRHLGLQGGKDRKLRLLNLDNMNRQGGTGNVGGELALLTLPFDMGGEMHTAPAVWTNPSDGSTWAIISTFFGIGAYQVTVDGSGTPGLTLRWTASPGGTSPLIANGVLYDVTSNLLMARDPSNGNLLWQTTQVGSIHWQSPIVANGVLYLTDNSGALIAFALPSNRSAPKSR